MRSPPTPPPSARTATFAERARRSRAIAVLAGFATLGSLAALYLAGHELPSRPDSRLHQAIGRRAAQEALNLLRPGGQIIVFARDGTSFKHPATDLQLDAFRLALARGHATIASLKTLQVDPLRQMQVPPGDFYEAIRKAPPGSVIVSFMGPPLLGENQRQQLGEIKAAIVAFCPGNVADQVDLRSLFDQHLLQAAIVGRRQPATPPAKSPDADARFDRFYLAVTAQNVADLTSGTSANP